MKEYQKAQIHEIVTVTPRISEICRWESMILRKVTSLELIKYEKGDFVADSQSIVVPKEGDRETRIGCSPK